MLSALESNESGETSAEHPLVGKLIEQRYRVISHIGSGGMADVYEIEHVALGRRLAMKVLRQTRSSNPQLVRRFSREARAASRIDSEHVVAIHDYGTLPEGQPFFVMELLRGQNLRELLVAHAPLPVVRVVNLAIDVCLGLHAAHAAGLVHRDLKPENLWLSRGDDGREVCVLLDFGVARFDGAHTTGDGVLVGTARYMSPEQIGSETAPGPGSDLFSLAVIIYECLTGKAPFAADSLERTLFRILNEAPRPVSELCADVPVELATVLDRALAKRPEQRFGSALELAVALRPFAGASRPLPALELARRPALSESTLAESDDEELSPSGVSGSAAERRAQALTAGSRRWQTWPLAFVAGTILGGLALLALRPTDPRARVEGLPEASSRPPIASGAATTTAAPMEPAASTPTESASPIAPVPSPPPAPSARSRPQSPPATPPPRAPNRPEPPRPNFDGRNPYFK
jgi:serine/threonine protein kinase